MQAFVIMVSPYLFTGVELLVWYGDSYVQFLGIPVALKEMGGDNACQVEESECNPLYF